MYKTLIIVLLLTYNYCKSQNLIPNGSFEQYFGCPTSHSQLDSAKYWFNLMTNIPGTSRSGTPDYFNDCSSSSLVSVPNNNWGVQEACSGNGYSGILLYLFNTSNVREYLEVPLITPLELDECYHFEMYVSLGDYSKYSTDDIQIYFSDSIIIGVNDFYPLPFVPQISNSSGTFLNRNNWTLVSGNYISHGGENYLIVGNFKADSLTNLVIERSISPQKSAYAYIDDVSLVQVPCSVGINGEASDVRITVYPNPFSNQIEVKLPINNQMTIIIYNALSQQILEQVFTSSTIINTTQFSDGIYFYKLSNSEGFVKSDKIIKK